MFAKRSQQRKETLEDPGLDPSRAIEDIGIRRAGSEFGDQSTEIGCLARAQLGDVMDPLDLTRSDQGG